MGFKFFVLNRAYHLCSAELDRMQALRLRRDEIEIEIIQSWRSEMEKLDPIPEDDNDMQ